jgi:hypothetical protein
MSGHGGGGASLLGELKFFILFLIVLWIIWFFTGGPSRADDQKPFIEPPVDLGAGEIYGPLEN